jgi:4'-phosphopantetheinyl transferase
MFSPSELKDMIYHKPPASLLRNVPNSNIEAKLRRFYTYFCAKEAYLKLVGEGILADWIKECEFRNLQVPRPCLGNSVWGDKILASHSLESSPSKDKSDMLEIWLHGKEVLNVRTEMQAFEEDFIITTMLMPSNLLGQDVEFPSWETLDLEKDILAVAEYS